MNLLPYSRSLILVAIGFSASTIVQAQVAISSVAGAAPNPNAMLDLQGTNRGFLAPRVTASQRTSMGTTNSLLVYQTDSVSGSPVGYYYYDAVPAPSIGWRHINSDGAWVLGGNAGTNPATNFIGTTNNQPVIFKTNGLERMRLHESGSLIVSGTVVVPSELVEVNGGVRVGTTTTNNAGTFRFNPTTQHFEGYVSNPTVTGWVQMDNAFRTRDNQPYVPANAAPCNYEPAASIPIIDAGFPNTTMFGTTESPYSTLWEDGRHQYLYLASDLVAKNICPNQPIRGIGFQTTGGGYPTANFYEVSMKNTLASSTPNFDLSGLQLCHGPRSYNMALGWTWHTFDPSIVGGGGVAMFLWAGAPFNLLVEVCHDNQDWTSNWSVAGETTNFQANFGLFCDACGITQASSLCFFAAPTCPTAPPGTPAASGVNCTGWGHTGGCNLTTANQLWTCDGTFQWQGGFSGGNNRPLLKIDAKIQGGAGGTAYGQYLYSENGIMVGSAAWAAAGPPLGQNFKGPGTISAQKSVFGGAVLLSDHVFDRYYDNTIRAEDAQSAMGYMHYPIREMARYVERERHLPTIAGRAQWDENGRFSVDQLTTQLWVTVEEQSLYIQELNARMDALQQFLVEKRLKELKGQAAPLRK